MRTNYILFGLLISALGFSQNHQTFLDQLDQNTNRFSKVAMTIWDYAEMGYQEEKSSALLQQTLADEGFMITKGVAGIPTAFIAEYNNGGPVVAILGEYDALPGISQKAVAYQVSNEGKAGHACGHHLFGTASAAAAISLKITSRKIKSKEQFAFMAVLQKKEALEKYI